MVIILTTVVIITILLILSYELIMILIDSDREIDVNFEEHKYRETRKNENKDL
jgi:hypothetical protein